MSTLLLCRNKNPFMVKVALKTLMETQLVPLSYMTLIPLNIYIKDTVTSFTCFFFFLILAEVGITNGGAGHLLSTHKVNRGLHEGEVIGQ